MISLFSANCVEPGLNMTISKKTKTIVSTMAHGPYYNLTISIQYYVIKFVNDMRHLGDPTSYTNIRPIAVFQEVLPLVAAPNHIDKTDL
jgi:hypothetical protein